MNSLSWLLYGAEVAGNIRVIAALSAGALGICSAAALIGAGVGAMNEEADFPKRALRVARVFALWLLLPALFLAVSPSRNTIMLIAASEVGESIVTSEQAQQIGGEAGALATDSLRVLRKFINDQLAEGEK